MLYRQLCLCHTVHAGKDGAGGPDEPKCFAHKKSHGIALVDKQQRSKSLPVRDGTREWMHDFSVNNRTGANSTQATF